jgi:hypothetical protein
MHRYILRRIWLKFMAQYLVFSALSHYFRTSNFFSGLSTTDETLVVEMRIWCIKIGNVFALHHRSNCAILRTSDCMYHVYIIKSSTITISATLK